MTERKKPVKRKKRIEMRHEWKEKNKSTRVTGADAGDRQWTLWHCVYLIDSFPCSTQSISELWEKHLRQQCQQLYSRHSKGEQTLHIFRVVCGLGNTESVDWVTLSQWIGWHCVSELGDTVSADWVTLSQWIGLYCVSGLGDTLSVDWVTLSRWVGWYCV